MANKRKKVYKKKEDNVDTAVGIMLLVLFTIIIVIWYNGCVI